MEKARTLNVCIHKGLLPAGYRQSLFKTQIECAGPGDIGRAAKDWPSLNFIIYHPPVEKGFSTADDVAGFTKTGRIRWVAELSEIPEKYRIEEEAMRVSSQAFREGGSIPAAFACDGKDVSPPLTIDDVPRNAKSLALIVDDPDAPSGVFTHWVMYNIDPGTREIPEDSVPRGAVQGTNSFKKQQYRGPCPPSGTHRYFFKVFALDAKLDVDPNKGKKGVEEAIKGHVLEEAELMGRYAKR